MSHKSNKINKTLVEEEEKLQASLDEVWKNPFDTAWKWARKKKIAAANKFNQSAAGQKANKMARGFDQFSRSKQDKFKLDKGPIDPDELYPHMAATTYGDKVNPTIVKQNRKDAAKIVMIGMVSIIKTLIDPQRLDYKAMRSGPPEPAPEPAPEADEAAEESEETLTEEESSDPRTVARKIRTILRRMSPQSISPPTDVENPNQYTDPKFLIKWAEGYLDSWPDSFFMKMGRGDEERTAEARDRIIGTLRKDLQRAARLKSRDMDDLANELKNVFLNPESNDQNMRDAWNAFLNADPKPNDKKQKELFDYLKGAYGNENNPGNTSEQRSFLEAVFDSLPKDPDAEETEKDADKPEPEDGDPGVEAEKDAGGPSGDEDVASFLTARSIIDAFKNLPPRDRAAADELDDRIADIEDNDPEIFDKIKQAIRGMDEKKFNDTQKTLLNQYFIYENRLMKLAGLIK